MKLTSQTLSIVGPKGAYQDCSLAPLNKDDFWVAAIADGVGGYAGGETAAKIAISEVESSLTSFGLMDEIFARASAEIRRQASENQSLAKMSTTLTCLSIENGVAEVGHVGDTRITHFRGPGVLSRTEDQTEVQRLLKNGIITRGQAKRHPRQNVIYSALSGRNADYTLYQNSFDVQPGDRIILSTDGFHSLFTRRELAGISQGCVDLESFFARVQSELPQRKISDDATAVFIEVSR
ncbi:PP2C family protein-serine/threonine phosphatase [Shimia sp. MIT910701]|uniref:PP2C family protein-serine/threonine phosphatase n=1 Tax=Shimia sp. MIT910701 TaxID=3096987 RepID=UPI00399A1068